MGFDKIYVQAKKWDPKQEVSAPEVQKFMGALSIKHAKKGLFITTTRFTNEAREVAKNDPDHYVVLMDEEELVKLMIEYNVGVKEIKNKKYILKEIDEDYF